MSEESLQKSWVTIAEESDLGLWWLAADVRGLLGIEASEAQVREHTIRLLKPLLESGELRAVDLLPRGRCREWTDDVAGQLMKIEEEWKGLSRTPSIGDIVCFIGPR